MRIALMVILIVAAFFALTAAIIAIAPYIAITVIVCILIVGAIISEKDIE